MKTVILENVIEAFKEAKYEFREGADRLCDFVSDLYPDELQEETLSYAAARLYLAGIEQACRAVLARGDGSTGPMVTAVKNAAAMAAGMVGGLPTEGELRGEIVYHLIGAIHVHLCCATEESESAQSEPPVTR